MYTYILTSVDEAKSSGEAGAGGIGPAGSGGRRVELEDEGRLGAVEHPGNVVEAAAEQARPGRVLRHPRAAGLEVQKNLEEVAPGAAAKLEQRRNSRITRVEN